MAALEPIVVDCPTCGSGLPPLTMLVTSSMSDEGAFVISVEPDFGDGDWVAEVAETHPDCLDTDDES